MNKKLECLEKSKDQCNKGTSLKNLAKEVRKVLLAVVIVFGFVATMIAVFIITKDDPDLLTIQTVSAQKSPQAPVNKSAGASPAEKFLILAVTIPSILTGFILAIRYRILNGNWGEGGGGG